MSAADNETREVHGLRIEIDRAICVGFGDCVTAAPGGFALDGDSLAVFTAPEGEAPARLLEAARACPVDAITIWDAEGRRLLP